MHATLTLDKENGRYVFVAPDFALRFAVSHLIQEIEEVVTNEGGVLELVCSGYEDHIDLGYLTGRMGIDWDFSKYNVEVVK